jgi:hypothetical protein
MTQTGPLGLGGRRDETERGTMTAKTKDSIRVVMQRDRERMIELALNDLRSAKTRLASVRGMYEHVRQLARIEHAIQTAGGGEQEVIGKTGRVR